MNNVTGDGSLSQKNNDARWIWYPGDLELYHALKQNFSRVERGMGWPAFWKSSSFRQRVVFWKSYDLSSETKFRVSVRGTGFVRLIENPECLRTACSFDGIRPAGNQDGNGASAEDESADAQKESKHHFGEWISCGPGVVTVVIHAGRIEALPAAYVEGDIIRTDSGWTADDYSESVYAASNEVFTKADQDPADWAYAEKRIEPVRAERINGGTLYEWEDELTAVIEITAEKSLLSDMTVYSGESEDEALDAEHCYLHWKPEIAEHEGVAVGQCPRCAVRYLFIPGEQPEKVCAIYQYVEFPKRASFHCDDPLLNRIWEVAEHTFRLCSGIFFLDGIKRDQWIWGGDAYQSFFVNRYLLADAEIEKRTMIALRGVDPVTTHINTITDYSLIWILSVLEHYKSAGDKDFLRYIFPKLQSLLDFCETRVLSNGFIYGLDRDWIYIDWADIDRDDPVAGEQMLLYAAYEAAAEISGLIGYIRYRWEEPDYSEKAATLKDKIQQHFWSEDKGAFIDSYVSGNKHISRQTNILAIRTGIADDRQKALILKNVLHNDDVPAISTPYFQFYALDALAGLGEYGEVLDVIKSYWGGMLERGAATFWEEFDPSVTGTAQYDMYGDRFGKSLCHAWAASPVYLLARHFVGLEIERSSSLSFVLEPRLEFFRELDCTLPVGMDGAEIHIEWDGAVLKVTADGVSGVVKTFGREIFAESKAEVCICAE